MINRPDLLAAILLVAVLVITPVAADTNYNVNTYDQNNTGETIVDESLSTFVDTSNRTTIDIPTYQSNYNHIMKYNSLYFPEIEKHLELYYVVLDIPSATGRSDLAEGRHDITYTQNGQTKPGVIYVVVSRNLLGQVTHTQLTIFLNEWDIEGATGPATIVTNVSFLTGGNAYSTTDRVTSPPPCLISGPGPFGGPGFVPPGIQTITVSSAIPWRNHLMISTSDHNTELGGELTTILHREIEGRKYASTLNVIGKEDEVLYTNYDNVDIDYKIPKNYVKCIEVVSLGGQTFTFPLDSADPGDPGDPSRVMVHIIAQDARNENLLLDAAVEVRDQYDAVVAAGTTSPEGWMVFEYDLPDTLTDEDFDRYYTVSVSLPGWTQKVTNFKFYPAFIPRSGDWIRVEMLPDTDGPADPEKTYIMFFVRDIHANPLERASIEIAGQYWHTNSAGHVAVEVPKNSTTAYTVRKTGHVSISGSAAVGAEGSYVVNIALGPALPDRTPGPGDDPGATPPPRDTRTNEEKGKAVIDLIADNAELIATLAILAAVMGLINLIMPGRRRR